MIVTRSIVLHTTSNYCSKNPWQEFLATRTNILSSNSAGEEFSSIEESKTNKIDRRNFYDAWRYFIFKLTNWRIYTFLFYI